MKRFHTYRFTLMMGIFFLCLHLTACSPKQDTSNISEIWKITDGAAPKEYSLLAEPESSATLTPATPSEEAAPLSEEAAPLTEDQPDKAYGETLYVRDTTITLGESRDSILNKLGLPNRVVETEYDFDYYVYNNNYNHLLFIAIRSGLVEGYYTDSIEFKFKGITSGSNLNEINKALGQNYSLEEVLKYKNKKYTLHILIDKIGNQKTVGINVLSSLVKEDAYNDTVKRNIELLVYDLTNSVRARNGESVLSWSSSAANSSRKHSLDMADNQFFDHINLDGQKPGDRMREEGIAYNYVGENIIAGYGTAILSNHAWFNSKGHRNNLLSSKFRSLGVGFVYEADSPYKTYITQNFYR